jgi:hypothetical protein
MYISQTAVSEKELADLQSTLRIVGAAMSDDELATCAKAEVWSSSFSDPGPDFNELRLFDASGAQYATKQIAGY